MPCRPCPTRPPEAEPCQADEASESSSAPAEDEARAQDDAPRLRREGVGPGRLPGASHERRETVAECSLLVADDLRRIAVDVRRRHLDPDGEGDGEGAERQAEDARRLDPGA
jgi:hypothetical protein